MKALSALVLSGLLAGHAFAQPPTDAGTTNAISVELWVPPADQDLHAPASIHLVASVFSRVPAHPGDSVKMNFLADSKHLGSVTCTWHEGRRPDPNSRLPQPMIIVPPGYSAAQWVWKDVPAGTYSVTASVIAGSGIPVSSAPEQVTVKP